MTTVNSARFEESSEIVIDQEIEAPATGWTVDYASINRVGGLVAVHVEVTYASGAAAPVLTLQPDFAPADTVTDSTGNFTIDDTGLLSFVGSTTGGGSVVAQFVYQAGQTSP